MTIFKTLQLISMLEIVVKLMTPSIEGLSLMSAESLTLDKDSTLAYNSMNPMESTMVKLDQYSISHAQISMVYSFDLIKSKSVISLNSTWKTSLMMMMKFEENKNEDHFNVLVLDSMYE